MGVVHASISMTRFIQVKVNFEKKIRFLPLGVQSTLIRHENRAFQKRSIIRRNLEIPTFSFSMDEKDNENGGLIKRCHHGNYDIFLFEFYSNTNAKWPLLVASSNPSDVVWTENFSVACDAF